MVLFTVSQTEKARDRLTLYTRLERTTERELTTNGSNFRAKHPHTQVRLKNLQRLFSGAATKAPKRTICTMRDFASLCVCGLLLLLFCTFTQGRIER